MNRTFAEMGNYKTASGYLGDLSFDDLEQLKEDGYIFDYSGFYNEKTRALLEEIFRQEIQAYEYNFPY